MTDFAQTEIERRLSLYQVFLKLYEHHSSLLDEILQQENLSQPLFKKMKSCYVHGVVDTNAVYLMTNLCDNQTQSLQQPQQIWTIGRNRNSGICIADNYMSRRHAAIQYIDDQGFYFIDFNSTNGSFVNGDRAFGSIKLKDGDRIRVGNMTFDFFMNSAYRILPSVAMELLMQLVYRKNNDQVEIRTLSHDRQKSIFVKADDNLDSLRNSPLFQKLEHHYDNFSLEQKSEILDRFFSRKIP
ncbi:MAG: FHA domain-containing protein [Nostoc sp. DedVER02]|uniref:FHA domain-containing protein n=1 Tax=unclassified Nostoc TaxID=2593658 RepID=UPI002AD44E34|nr:MULTISPECIES: FHA domain-containing protein [unclassified Nostoc]MDZ7987160.1 FHA domain-containing protein [Nostoc sp. DedVER02]MDZ8110970.1 FHA domain-containing protein [Nostoc sp. DedVER01b]